MKKGLIIAAVVLTAAGIAVFAAAFAFAGFDFSRLSISKYETNVYAVDGEFKNIGIETAEADVVFKPSEDGKTRVECTEREKAKHSVGVENGTLKITVEDRREWYDHLDVFSKPQSMTVYLPEGEYSALKVACRTGDVTVPEKFSFGEADLSTNTGDVELRADVDGAVSIAASTGSVKLSGVAVGSAEISASTGRITVESVSAEGFVSVKYGTGKTAFSDVACKDLTAKGGTGEAVLKNVSATGSLKVETGTGDVTLERCDGGEIFIKTSTGDVTGSLLSDKIFSAHTSTGRVNVPDTASGGKCEIKTSTGDISITIEK